jgi:hypothetical protein
VDHNEQQQSQRRVIMAYSAQFENPIWMRSGEPLVVDREEPWDDNPDWIWVWCRDPRGREGWVPRPYIAYDGDHATAARDYSAAELSVTAGEEVTASTEESGWLWCTNARGQSGWVPIANLALGA